MSARILVVDDEESLLDFIRLLLEEVGYQVRTANSLEEGTRVFFNDSFDLVLCDIMMPDGNGLELLKAIKAQKSRTSVLMMTAYTSTKSAIEAMKLGAYDYISKPFDVEELKVVVQKAIEKTALVEENVYLRRELEDKYHFTNIVGTSSAMLEVFSLVEKVAQTGSTVLLQGESGTGKELIARAIHFSSQRSQHRFLSINCGALPENLLESELFGHERGAFTGAVQRKKGLFQESSSGTLFLDEIGEMTPSMQVKLLRALQEKTIRRVGGNTEEKVDVRIIAATNQDLQEKISSNEFREDLFYRINVIPIHLPALRQRRDDIPLLVNFFIKKCSKDLGIEAKQISVEAMRSLENYDWPGNVRELENLIERSLTLSSGEVISAADIPARVGGRTMEDQYPASLPAEGIDLEDHLDKIRASLMRQALDRASGVQTRAAEILGISFRSFRYYSKKIGLSPEARQSDEVDTLPPTAPLV
jgi:two-component system response regulator PilR (NtrC family)